MLQHFVTTYKCHAISSAALLHGNNPKPKINLNSFLNVTNILTLTQRTRKHSFINPFLALPIPLTSTQIPTCMCHTIRAAPLCCSIACLLCSSVYVWACRGVCVSVCT